MEIQPLIKMANQIGQFFEAWPDPAQARSEIANHLQRFWEPRMRRAIVAHVEQGGEGLALPVQEAVKLLAQRQPGH
ncbi:formate dehydrogenase [Azoarcus sp. TTM-91]|uniref:formate dehydrogenase subunit delta n=1 Tax=Azoarcus sp. TTM-91 TaxID=2691581 RepID=UPI00145CF086|nr:formate dehydrogenase subunit delta [Azoarcus sp. TTM-91]NMG32971.1 formate dehydrogenase [Azoarcus sp. TTM-91]